MARRPAHAPLRVYLNGQSVGLLKKEPNGAAQFGYSVDWLDNDAAQPVSLSLPLRPEPYQGEAVNAVFENLLPDSIPIRKRVAEKVGARGIDAYSLLAAIGRDCVGALQFVTEDRDIPVRYGIDGEPVDDEDIEKILTNLARAPLGLDRDDDFRISVAGAQEKTALLWYEGRWLKPQGTTPTTHIFKTQIGTLPGGIDLQNSVENEFYCLELARAFRFPVNRAEMATFGNTKALVIERFDRRVMETGKIQRVAQEDFCQALGFPSASKYQNEGGPGIVQIMTMLEASDHPVSDRARFFMSQIFFWLIGATDGHAKNFSVFLHEGGSFRLTPLYDILTVEPIRRKQDLNRKSFKLAMAVGDNNHYRLDRIAVRHFAQTAHRVGMPDLSFNKATERLVEWGQTAFDHVETVLPDGFPGEIHEAVKAAALPRLRQLEDFLDSSARNR